MVEDLRIDRFIDSIVTQSGLDAQRQDNLARELRDHLQQLISVKIEEGFEPNEAVETALAQFGSARTIRRGILRYQRRLRIRSVLSNVRQTIGFALGVGTMLGVGVAIASTGASPMERFMIAVASAIGLTVGLTLPVFVAYSWCKELMLRAPDRRVTRWSLRIGSLLVALWVLGTLAFGLGTCLFEMKGWRAVYAASLIPYVGVALAWSLPVLAAAALVGALLVAFLPFHSAKRLRQETGDQ